MKKLMVVTPYFYPKIGGLENYAYNISLGLKKKYKWDVVVITSNHEEKKYKEEKINGLKIYRMPYWFKVSNTPINPLWYFQIKNIIKKENPDIINAHSPVPFISDVTSFVKGNIPFILTYHSGSMKKGKFYTDYIIGIYEKFLLSKMAYHSNKIICVSNFVKKSMFPTMSKKIAIITPGVDINKFKPKKYKSSNTVLFIGNQKEMYSLKGLDYLIKAIEGIPDIRLNVIGEKIESNNSRIRYLGYKTQKELIKEIQKSSIVVLPSIIQESFGMVLIEGMACKKPVIGTNIGGIPEVIKNNINGLITPPSDYKKLRSTINKINIDITFAKKLAENGYERVHKYYDWDKKIFETKNYLN